MNNFDRKEQNEFWSNVTESAISLLSANHSIVIGHLLIVKIIANFLIFLFREDFESQHWKCQMQALKFEI